MDWTIGDALKSRNNNFDAIRLVAALLVLHTHSFAQTGAPGDSFISWTGYAGSQLGLGAFFIISGFLVTASIMNRQLTSYFMSRLLRIFPALFVLSLATAFMLGPWLTTLSIDQYLSDPATIGYLKTSTVFGWRNTLPGVFTDNPLAQSVNGSLWTLPIETLNYLCLPWLYLTGALRKKVIAGLVAIMTLCAFTMATAFNVNEQTPILIANATPLFVFWKYATYFLFGAMFYVHRFDIPVSGGLAAMSVLALFALGGTAARDWTALPALTYLVLYLALARPCTAWLSRVFGDLSYGTYIWAFPIQQSIVAIAGPQIGPLMLQAVATPIVLTIAFVSWRVIERPALGLKRRFDRRTSVDVAVRIPDSRIGEYQDTRG
jgi:peptidoglycan/LPS O-acetylase OafA/YrhL